MTHAAASPQLGRRELILGTGAAALAALFVGPARGALDVLPLIGDSADPFSRSPIVAKIGETFQVASGTAKGAVLELTEIIELPAFTDIGDIENQFIVRFVGPTAPVLAQDTYEFATKSFGDLPLFVTPVSDPGATNVVYEAIINRYVPNAASQGGQP